MYVLYIYMHMHAIGAGTSARKTATALYNSIENHARPLALPPSFPRGTSRDGGGGAWSMNTCTGW